MTMPPPEHIPVSNPETVEPHRPLGHAILRGLGTHCPSCGQSRLFTGYLTLNDKCPVCGIDFQRYRADDAPAYFTIVIVGHIIVPLLLVVERTYSPSTMFQLLLWLPLSLILTLAILPRAKGALIGINWATEAGG